MFRYLGYSISRAAGLVVCPGVTPVWSELSQGEGEAVSCGQGPELPRLINAPLS